MQLASDELYLKGRLQIMTAQQALSITGLNPRSEADMAARVALLEPYSPISARVNLNVYRKGKDVAQEKAHVVESLHVMADYKKCPEDWRIAAEELLVIMGITAGGGLENEEQAIG